MSFEFLKIVQLLMGFLKYDLWLFKFTIQPHSYFDAPFHQNQSTYKHGL